MNRWTVPAAGLLAAGLALTPAAPALAQQAVPITLNGTTATSTGAGVTIAGGVVTITEPGTYRVSGTLTDGQLVVDSAGDGTVQVILDGASITSTTSAAINVANATEVVVELAAGTSNRLVDASQYVYPDAETDEPDAALFSASDLVIAGTGSLAVDGNAYDGIASKDTLVIRSGTITVDAVDDGIRGKDYIEVLGGNITVTAGSDGLKSTNSDDPALGYISIAGATVNLAVGDDAVGAQSSVTVSSGTVRVTEGFEGLEALKVAITGGDIAIKTRDDSINAVEEGLNEFATSTVAAVDISGGTVVVDSEIDGIDSNGAVTISGGTVVVSGPASGSPGEGAFDANGPLNFTGGTVLGAGQTAMAVFTAPPTTGQGWVAARLPSRQPAGTVVHVVADGAPVVSYQSPKAFQELVFSSDAITNGQTYEIHTGGSVGADPIGGMSTGGSLNGATMAAEAASGQYSGGLVGGGFPGGPGGGGFPPPPGGGATGR